MKPEFDEEGGYIFDPRDLFAVDEEVRGWAIMAVSRNRIKEYEKVLLDILPTEECARLRRHIVRGLGNLESRKAIPMLLGILGNESGLIIGDTVGALEEIGAVEAIPIIEAFEHSQVEFIANKSKHALKVLREKKGK